MFFKEFLKIYLKEELTDKQKKTVDSYEHNSKINNENDPFKDRQRIIIPYNSEKSIESPTSKQIHGFLKDKGYSPSDYIKGTVKDKFGRETRIGKALEKNNAPKDLIHNYLQDPSRQLHKSKQDKQIVISRHPYDICGMSTGRHWTSCMNMNGGEFKRKLRQDLKHGTHVAYLTHKGDDEAKEPLARIALKKFSNEQGHEILRPEQKVYGTASIKDHDNFLKHVNKWSEDNYKEHEDSVYRKHKDLYNDDNRNSIIKIGDINKALEHPDSDVRVAAIQHPNATSEHINKALNDPDSGVREIAIKHPNATSENVDKALNDSNEWVRLAVIEHPNATSEHISKALKDSNSDVREAAIRHPNATSEHISKALKDSDTYVRRAAIQHPNATSEHIHKALNDPDKDVRRTAIRHPKATSEHIDKALNDSDVNVANIALQHKNFSKNNINAALSSRHAAIRELAKNKQKEFNVL